MVSVSGFVSLHADGGKDKVYRGNVESKEQLADVVAAINSALRTAYGPLIQLHPAETEISFVDGVLTGTPPDRVRSPATYRLPSLGSARLCQIPA